MMNLVRRILDVSAASAGLMALSPLMLAIAAAIRLESPGPVFYQQRRLGRDGKEFDILKFRSMVQDAGVIQEDPLLVFNSEQDPRITRVGRFLRKWSLDELPQLLNVLGGTMSIVGPRPDLPEAVRYYQGIEWAKLQVKPGITGPSQVGGRNALEVRERWRIDAEYALRQSLTEDVSILRRTIQVVLRSKGVYR